jgi:hypothetical protein
MTCPWCKRVELPVHLLKRHIKYCASSPRPRGLRHSVVEPKSVALPATVTSNS